MLINDTTTSTDSVYSNNYGLTTNASWAWLNSNQKQPIHYSQLNLVGMNVWKYDTIIKSLPVWNGSIVQNKQPISVQDLLLYSSYYAIEGPIQSKKRLYQLEPNIGSAFVVPGSNDSDNYNDTNVAEETLNSCSSVNSSFDNNKENNKNRNSSNNITAIYHFPSEGLVDPIEAVQVLRQAAIKLGVIFQSNCTVTGIVYSNDDVDQENNNSKFINNDSNSNSSNKDNRNTQYNQRRIVGVQYDTSNHNCDCESVNERDQKAQINKNQQSMVVNADIVIAAAGIGTASNIFGSLPMSYQPGTIVSYNLSSSEILPGINATSTTSSSTTSRLSEDSQPLSKSSVTTKTIKNRRLIRILVDTISESHILQRRDGTIVIGGGYLQVGGQSSATSTGTIPSTSSSLTSTDKGTTRIADVDDNNDNECNTEILDNLQSVAVRQLLTSAIPLAASVLDETINNVSLQSRSITSASAIRPIPADGYPAIGFMDNSNNTHSSSAQRGGLYYAVTHSGITLAPVLGPLIAAEIIYGIDFTILQPYRPNRLFLKE